MDVAREGGLGDMEAAGGEAAAQLVLIGYGAGLQELANYAVSLLLHGDVDLANKRRFLCDGRRTVVRYLLAVICFCVFSADRNRGLWEPRLSVSRNA
jgi:hypothetical protein